MAVINSKMKCLRENVKIQRDPAKGVSSRVWSSLEILQCLPSNWCSVQAPRGSLYPMCHPNRACSGHCSDMRREIIFRASATDFMRKELYCNWEKWEVLYTILRLKKKKKWILDEDRVMRNGKENSWVIDQTYSHSKGTMGWSGGPTVKLTFLLF